MDLQRIFAQLNCTDLDASAKWFGHLFSRAEDTNPMSGLKEWHHGDSTGFQLVENPDDAGHGSMTLIVADIEDERDRLTKAGISLGDVIEGDFAILLQMSDPSGNTIVLAEINND